MKRSPYALLAASLALSRLCLADDAASSAPNRLDLSVPDVPAFTALGASPSKISEPTNVKDFVAALASGISPDGHVQAGVAIEVAPTKLVDNIIHGGSDTSVLLQDVFGGLRLSLGTNSVASGSDTKNQWAIAGRWSFLSYTPETDRSLNACISKFIQPPTIEESLPKNDLPPGVPPSPMGMAPTQPPPPDQGQATGTAGAPNADLAALRADVDALKVKAAAQEKQTSAPTAAENKTYGAMCRTAGQAAHLAQNGVEIAYVYSEQAINSSDLSSFAAAGDTVWLAASLGYNSYAFPNPPGLAGDRAHDRPLWRATLDKDHGDGAWGIQGTAFARYDSARLTDWGWQGDVFLAARASLRTQGWSAFLESGYRFTNVTTHPIPPAKKADGVPIGLGGDLRLADGTWFGLYLGYDALTNQILSLGNIKWSIGQNRPY